MVGFYFQEKWLAKYYSFSKFKKNHFDVEILVTE